MRKEVKNFHNFLSTSKMKNFKKLLLTLTNGLKSSTEKKNLAQTLKKNLLKNRLSIRVRNFAPLNEPPNIFMTNFYFNPKVALTHRKKRFASFPSPAGMSLPNSPWAGIMTS
jgi:hypothetical protein